jgi:hypothetical protein
MDASYSPIGLTLREAERLSLVPGIQPFKESNRIWVPPSDVKYRFLAGNGESLSGCGAWMWRGCLEDHVKHELSPGQLDLCGAPAEGFNVAEAYRASCGRMQCPVCYEKAAAKESVRISHRIMQYKVGKLLPIHMAVSVAERDWALPFLKMRKLAERLALESGLLGGSIMFHPFRKVNESEEYEQLHPDFSWRDAPACWYVSPHFHIIGFGWIHGERVREIYERTGWIVKNLGVRKPLPGQKVADAVRGTAHYQLSHCGVNERFHTVVWFGALAYNKMHCSPVPPEEHSCPECGAEMMALRFVDSELKDIVESSLMNEGFFNVSVGMFEYKPGLRDPGG